MPARTEKYVELYCDVPYPSIILGTSLNMLLILGCSILAFVARNLPDNFNESWYIFICVTTTLVVWIGFFTSYYSAFYQLYKAAILGAALILNSLVVIFALFGPKIYAIVFVADADVQISNFQGTISRGGASTAMTSVDEAGVVTNDDTQGTKRQTSTLT